MARFNPKESLEDIRARRDEARRVAMEARAKFEATHALGPNQGAYRPSKGIGRSSSKAISQYQYSAHALAQSLAALADTHEAAEAGDKKAIAQYADRLMNVRNWQASLDRASAPYEAARKRADSYKLDDETMRHFEDADIDRAEVADKQSTVNLYKNLASEAKKAGDHEGAALHRETAADEATMLRAAKHRLRRSTEMLAKRQKAGDTSTLAKLGNAKKEAKQHGPLQTGARGGQYYESESGQKVYVGKK